MIEHLYQIETESGEVLERGLTLAEAEYALCRHINLGAEDAYIADDDSGRVSLPEAARGQNK